MLDFLGGYFRVSCFCFYFKLVCLPVIYFIFRNAFLRTNICLKVDSVLGKEKSGSFSRVSGE